MKLNPISIIIIAGLALVSCGTSKNIYQREDQAVNIGYGEIPSDHNVSATSRLKVKHDDAIVYTTMADYLRGKVPGVMVGGDGKIVIRGISTINADSTPLFIVDGVEAYSIDNIPPSTVKSVDIIKDGTSAIYGVKGANGVIIITTKKGGDD